MIRRPPRSTLSSSSAASDVYKRQHCKQFADIHDRRYTHALKKSKPCDFLTEDDRCHVYVDRPRVCADFPFVVDPKTGNVIEIRLFPFCNVPFNVVQYEVTRRVLEGAK